MGDNPAINIKDQEKKRDLEKTINAQWSFSHHLNLHLGYIYGAGNLGFEPQGEEMIPANRLFFKQQCVPGGKLPITRNGETISTLDLISHSGFTVLATSGQFSLTKEGVSFKIPLVFYQQGRQCIDADSKWSNLMGLKEGQRLVVV
ncbi:hypothetical protein CEP53_011874 [Fusarium sp. AF-6]|nr:hypothetical protein CEP53_011874 [Fusarium sp. AF-6]